MSDRAPRTFEVQQGIPIPPQAPSAVVNLYPWAEMEVGDSFFVPVEMKNPRALCAKAEERYAGRRYEFRRTRETDPDWAPEETEPVQDPEVPPLVRGVRIWRTA